MDFQNESLRLHYEWAGKLEYKPKMALDTKEALSLAYTPGVAAPCLEIARDIQKSYSLTGRHNLVAVITDGTAVLGLGDIGPEAAMPVMEGKCAIFKAFAGVDAIPLCIRTKDVGKIVDTVALLAGSFGGINLEDISAPRCFEIEEKLKERCDIPVFHDDQHGTSIVTLAALMNALKLTGKNIGDIRVVISGAGAAGVAVLKLLTHAGLRDAIMCDTKGAIYEGRPALDPIKSEIAGFTNRSRVQGGLGDALRGADVFIGVSAPGIVTSDMVGSMAKDPIVFAMSNPVPEIMPDIAAQAGAAIVGTGRSDFPNQINNALAFPGVFRGALDVRASEINTDMKIAAAFALAELARDDLSPGHIMPFVFDPRVSPAIAAAVAKTARDTGAARC